MIKKENYGYSKTYEFQKNISRTGKKINKVPVGLQPVFVTQPFTNLGRATLQKWYYRKLKKTNKKFHFLTSRIPHFG